MGSGKWVVVSGKWVMVSKCGEWSMGVGVGSGQWEVVNGQWMWGAGSGVINVFDMLIVGRMELEVGDGVIV